MALLVAVALLVAPVLPAVAKSGTSDQPVAHAMHAHHAVADAAADSSGACDSQESCHGDCCATCVQCFMADLGVLLASAPAHAVQAPVVNSLRSQLFSAGRDRPPR
jgi:hypothetical protein